MTLPFRLWTIRFSNFIKRTDQSITRQPAYVPQKCVDNGRWSSVRGTCNVVLYFIWYFGPLCKDQRPSCDRRRDKWKIQIDKYRQSNVHESDGLSGNVHYRDYLLFIQITSRRTIIVIITVWNTEHRLMLLYLIWDYDRRKAVACSVDINFSAKRYMRTSLIKNKTRWSLSHFNIDEPALRLVNGKN